MATSTVTVQLLLLLLSPLLLGVVEKCHHLNESILGGRSSRVTMNFVKCQLWSFVILRMISKSKHFQSIPLVGRGREVTKEYSAYALDNVDNSGRPLTNASTAGDTTIATTTTTTTVQDQWPVI